jgi:hypothetical protein
MKITIRGMVSIILLFYCVVSAQAADWKKALKESLTAQYRLTKTGWGDESRITAPGAVYIVQAEGISARSAKDMSMLVTTVENGQAHQPKGGLSFFVDTKNTRQVKVGERFYIVAVDIKDSGIMFRLVSVDTFDVNVDGNTTQIRYRSVLWFPIPQIESTAAADLKKIFDPIFRSETEAAAANTKTIQMGQSPAEVEGILGKPDKVVDLGAKKIFVYKDMKVVFLDSKVSDVQ